MDKIIHIALDKLAEITQARGEQYKRLLNRLLLQVQLCLIVGYGEVAGEYYSY